MSTMHLTILDCYTDEASGLGVPPYLGTYPRYLYAKLKAENPDATISYLTIDDLRLWKKYDNTIKPTTPKDTTNIKIYNLTLNKASDIIPETDLIYIILGVHVPGKYLTAHPGTLKELLPLIKDIKKPKVLTGPAIYGTQLEGGKFAEVLNDKQKQEYNIQIQEYNQSFEELSTYAPLGAELLNQIPTDLNQIHKTWGDHVTVSTRRMIEIETGRGCKVGKCSFCTEPLKANFQNRPNKDIIKEFKAYYQAGARFFRLGKQADFYASEDPIALLETINKECPNLEMLHIDNVNPNSVVADKDHKITKAIVKYCTEGNIAAFGVESFDPEVVKANLLNTHPIIARKAIEIINKYGGERGPNGLHKFLPGINIIFGLLKETKESHKHNIDALKHCIDNNLLLRRINVRKAAVLPDTFLEKHGGNKYLRKNKHLYWKWRNQIRQEVDFPMLKLLFPLGTILSDVYTEMYDGKTTFARQMGTYPIVIGIKGRLPLNQKIKVKVTDHQLRSITAELVEEQ